MTCLFFPEGCPEFIYLPSGRDCCGETLSLTQPKAAFTPRTTA